MLNRSEFQSATARQGLVKTPVEYITGLLYQTGIAASVAHPEWYAEDMGQAMFYPPNVSGWKINGYWVNASAAAARASFAGNLRWRLQTGRVAVESRSRFAPVRGRGPTSTPWTRRRSSTRSPRRSTCSCRQPRATR